MTFQRESYFEWLYDQAFADDRYKDLMRILFGIPFTWVNPQDKNRASDGISLRRAYLFENGRSRESYYWDDSECTFLEMFLGLAFKFAMLLDKTNHDAALHLLRNTDFHSMVNGNTNPDHVIKVAQDIMSRNYDFDGYGGFFPLGNPQSNQRDVEILYQMNQYIIEYGW